MDNENLILMTDSYKLSHYRQYPPGSQKVYSYMEARKNAEFPHTVFFGLQYYIKKYLCGTPVTKEKIDAAELLVNQHMGPGLFNKQGWLRLLEKHNGALPIEIKAVPEGTVVPKDNVLLTIENTDPEFPWLTSYLETLLLKIWYPSTVATVSYNIRKVIEMYLEKTGDPSLIGYKLHDFGYRGASSEESAGLGGLAHLISFNGTDTLAALTTGINYYDSGVIGHSIPASEHSTITSWGVNGELAAFSNMLQQYPEGLVACVSDSYDLKRAVQDYWGTALKYDITFRNGTLVVRPDSGDPVESVINTLTWLSQRFGSIVNSKGYTVLDPHIRVIQGDGCNLGSIVNILTAMEEKKFSADNIAFGMGGGLLQKVDRDTQSFAFKCSSISGTFGTRDVFKQPATDLSKKSKRGRLSLVRRSDGVLTTTSESPTNDELKTVYIDGDFIGITSFEQVRNRARNG
jgi:nicotinamide phosphoribosyltransferase